MQIVKREQLSIEMIKYILLHYINFSDLIKTSLSDKLNLRTSKSKKRPYRHLVLNKFLFFNNPIQTSGKRDKSARLQTG